MSVTTTHTVEHHVERLRRELASGVSQVRAVARDGGPGLDDALYVVEGLLDEFVKLAAVAPRDESKIDLSVEGTEGIDDLSARVGDPVEEGPDLPPAPLPGPDLGPRDSEGDPITDETPAIVTVFDEMPAPVIFEPGSEETPIPPPVIVPMDPVAGSGPASLTIDADFRLVQASEAFLQLFDARPGVFATSCYELLGRVEPCEPCAGGMAHASSGPVTRDIGLDDRVYRVAARPIPLPDGHGVVETFEDVTEEVRSEANAAALAGRTGLSAPPLGPDAVPRSVAPPARSVWRWVGVAAGSLGGAAVALFLSAGEPGSPPGSRVVSELSLEELLGGDAPITVLSTESSDEMDLGPPPGAVPTPMELGAAVRSSVGVPASGAGPSLPLSRDVPFQDKVADAVARELVAQGDYMGAALAWEEMIAAELPNRWTIALETNCLASSLVETLGRFKSDSSVVFKPVILGGRDCYLVIYGSFPTREAAEAAIAFLPTPYPARASDLLVRTFRRLP